MKNNKLGFTIVELVTVMIIIIILGTISFMSYGGYLVGVRDTNRISQVSGINKALNSYGVKNTLPLPDNYVTVEIAGGVIGYQGYAGKEVLKKINYKKGGKDPLDTSYYTYYLSKNRKHSQMMTFLEQEQLSLNPLDKTYANTDYSERIIHTYGNELGALTEDITNIPIQEVAAIKTAKKISLSTELNRYRATFSDKDYITSIGSNLLNLKKVIERGGKGCSANTGEIVCSTNSVTSSVANIVKTIVGNNSIGRKWSDGTVEKSCNGYKNPVGLYSYTGNTGDGKYLIKPNGQEIRVDCDMTTKGGGWTIATKFYGGSGNSLFNIVGSNSKLSTVWPLTDITKDIMLKCVTTNPTFSQYSIPFIIKSFPKSKVAFLENHTGVDLGLVGKWNGFTLNVASVKGNFALKDNGGKFLWRLDDIKKLRIKATGGSTTSPFFSTSYNSLLELNNSNYCTTAIK